MTALLAPSPCRDDSRNEEIRSGSALCRVVSRLQSTACELLISSLENSLTAMIPAVEGSNEADTEDI